MKKRVVVVDGEVFATNECASIPDALLTDPSNLCRRNTIVYTDTTGTVEGALEMAFLKALESVFGETFRRKDGIPFSFDTQSLLMAVGEYYVRGVVFDNLVITTDLLTTEVEDKIRDAWTQFLSSDVVERYKDMGVVRVPEGYSGESLNFVKAAIEAKEEDIEPPAGATDNVVVDDSLKGRSFKVVRESTFKMWLQLESDTGLPSQDKVDEVLREHIIDAFSSVVSGDSDIPDRGWLSHWDLSYTIEQYDSSTGEMVLALHFKPKVANPRPLYLTFGSDTTSLIGSVVVIAVAFALGAIFVYLTVRLVIKNAKLIIPLIANVGMILMGIFGILAAIALIPYYWSLSKRMKHEDNLVEGGSKRKERYHGRQEETVESHEEETWEEYAPDLKRYGNRAEGMHPSKAQVALMWYLHLSFPDENSPFIRCVFKRLRMDYDEFMDDWHRVLREREHLSPKERKGRFEWAKKVLREYDVHLDNEDLRACLPVSKYYRSMYKRERDRIAKEHPDWPSSKIAVEAKKSVDRMFANMKYKVEL